MTTKIVFTESTNLSVGIHLGEQIHIVLRLQKEPVYVTSAEGVSLPIEDEIEAIVFFGPKAARYLADLLNRTADQLDPQG